MSITRSSTTMKLWDIINPDDFNSTVERGSVDDICYYRIPMHNRFPQWKPSKSEELVDSIMKNYPIHSIMTSRHVRNNNIYEDIEDGQTRLSVLQNYVRGNYTWNGQTYAELSETNRNKFNSYEVRVEIIKKPPRGMSEKTFNAEIHNIFERLNSGKPLSGNDKYHLHRSSSPVIILVLELKDAPEFRDNIKKYIGKIGEGKTRVLLSDMVGCVLPLTRIDTSRTDCINTSYERNSSYIRDIISEESKQNVLNFFRFYFALLDDALTSVTTPRKCYGKLSGVLGLLVYAWIQNAEHVQNRDYNIWKNFITCGLTRGYQDALFNNLRPGDRRNLTSSSLNIRWLCVLNADTILNDAVALQLQHAQSIMLENGESEIESDTDTDTE